jgi:hypothetical protein
MRGNIKPVTREKQKYVAHTQAVFSSLTPEKFYRPAQGNGKPKIYYS